MRESQPVTKYFICSESNITGAKSRGITSLPKKTCESIIAAAERRHPGVMRHWLEEDDGTTFSYMPCQSVDSLSEPKPDVTRL